MYAFEGIGCFVGLLTALLVTIFDHSNSWSDVLFSNNQHAQMSSLLFTTQLYVLCPVSAALGTCIGTLVRMKMKAPTAKIGLYVAFCCALVGLVELVRPQFMQFSSARWKCESTMDRRRMLPDLMHALETHLPKTTDQVIQLLGSPADPIHIAPCRPLRSDRFIAYDLHQPFPLNYGDILVFHFDKDNLITGYEFSTYKVW